MNAHATPATSVSPLHLLWTIPVGTVAFFTGAGIGGGLMAAFVVFVLGLHGPMAAFLSDGAFYFFGALAVQLFRQALASHRGLPVKPGFRYRWPVALGCFFGFVGAMNAVRLAALSGI